MPRPLLAALALAAALLAGLACSSAEPQAERAKALPAKPHTVLLILDEFPGDSLLDERGEVDPVRYPNFAALAADSVWFRNAYSSYDSTTKAVPLILDGMRPRPGTTPDRRGHPRASSTCSRARATGCTAPRRPRRSARPRCAAAGGSGAPRSSPT